jgi:rubredoxin-NAD+ reductase
MSEPLVIIGTGQAGTTVAREFRKLDPSSPMILITSDDGRIYSKPLLSNALAIGKDADALAMMQPEKFAGQVDATIHADTRVQSIDPRARIIRSDAGEISYRQLVFAVGANQIRIPVEGDADGDILTVNSLMDYAVFRERLTEGMHVTIFGAGLIGCEFANDLLAAGHQVTLIDPASYPMSRFVPEDVGRDLLEALSGIGAVMHLGRTAKAAWREETGYRVELDDGNSFSTGLILSAVGLKPGVELAEDAGIKTNRGIVVDPFLRTSDPNLFAIGDCAEVKGLVLPFIMPIMHAGRALAKTLAGEETALVYPAMPVTVKTPCLPLVSAPAVHGEEISWKSEEVDDGKKLAGYDEENQLRALTLTGGATKQAFAACRDIPNWLGPAS